MTQTTQNADPRPMMRPLVLGAGTLALIALTAWFFGPLPYSTTNPYADDIQQNPTGAGSNPDGAAAVIVDGVVVNRDAGEIMDGSTAATGLTGITDPDAEIPTPNGRRTLAPDEVIAPDRGTINNSTGTVQATEGDS